MARLFFFLFRLSIFNPASLHRRKNDKVARSDFFDFRDAKQLIISEIPKPSRDYFKKRCDFFVFSQ